MSYPPNIIQEMRDWISDCYWLDLDDAAELSDAEVVAGVARHYDGGIPEFLRTIKNHETTNP